MSLSLQSENIEKMDSPNVPAVQRIHTIRTKSNPINITKTKTQSLFREDSDETFSNSPSPSTSPLQLPYAHLISPQDYESYLQFRAQTK
jgi:hypothetical protein